ncbi:ParB/RepB/Spo0J family partition protein [uncultured Corynebacterium sp.]|uniref:ParB/RepB/Spo0J family partition protein n=1 Tax=uncultured Corynebacterium sp. TaxID=159447 RepID=UPI0025D1EF42|nr:ParB/RepB/Spo0J family partition protein [uncultured Corynebacterium sp.]
MAEAKRKSGLGKGLASLIPTGPAKPQIGNDAADVIFGANRGSNSAPEPSWYSLTKSPRHGQNANRSADGTTSDNSTFSEDADGQTGGSAKNIKAADNKGTASADTHRGRTKAGLPTNRSSLGQRAAAERKEAARDRTRPASSTAKKGKAQEAANSAASTPGASTTQAEQQSDSTPQEPLISDETATYRELPINAIIRNEKNPRQDFDQEALRELAHSIREFGLLQPIVVRQASEPGKFELIMGERRLRAAQLADLEAIPSIVREADDDTMLRDALLENIHRVQLNPLEEGAAYQQLLEEFGVTQAELAIRLGRSRPVISNTIRLLQLPLPVQRRVAAGVLSAGHARALMGVTQGPDAQIKLAERIVAEGLSVRATEEAVTLINRGEDKPKKKEPRAPRPQPEKMTHWADTFGDYLDTNVKVQMGAKKGKIVVEFAGMEDFDRIIAMLKAQDPSNRPDSGSYSPSGHHDVPRTADNPRPMRTSRTADASRTEEERH